MDLPEKEILNQLFQDNEKYPVVDAEPEAEVKEDIKTYIEKVEKEQYLSKPITDDYGQPLISPAQSPTPTIVLPVSQNQYIFGIKQKVSESLRWLVTWCGRLIKIFGARAVFRQTQTKP